jgi:hypothetical protein
VGGTGRAPGWGGGGPEESAVVVAGTEAGIVRVGVGVFLGSSEAVLGVMPSGLMGAFLWIGIGGIVSMCRCEVVPWCVMRCLCVLSNVSRK